MSAAVFLLVALAGAPSASAWGRQGHNVSADLAELRLTPAAKQQVDWLLAGEKDPTLSGVSTWADEMRSSGSDLAKRSASWHYVNIAENDCTYEPAVNGNGGSNVIEAVREQSATLGDTSQSKDARNQALKFVVHFVQDAAQPMHAGYAKDRGGNSAQVTYLGQRTNLHSVWDSRMLTAGGKSDAQYLQEFSAKPAPSLGAADPKAWVEASCRIAVSPGVYPAKSTIGNEYTNEFLPVAEDQMRLSGERLGKLLNDTLG
ncbi:S1/P1 nuclease [Acaricomes phytoseiuli]|uniref:S1/P1 nuclease n=1 Tax=Acaricomes phytoseiuli TaxID=291968 RepID=UPI0003750716|nr:S1/P1 nuclease [Acaricomes phytoseiuli]MCW1250274.1 S1/P1 nuclease [Acaricomes phytoseiuli]